MEVDGIPGILHKDPDHEEVQCIWTHYKSQTGSNTSEHTLAHGFKTNILLQEGYIVIVVAVNTTVFLGWFFFHGVYWTTSFTPDVIKQIP